MKEMDVDMKFSGGIEMTWLSFFCPGVQGSWLMANIIKTCWSIAWHFHLPIHKKTSHDWTTVVSQVAGSFGVTGCSGQHHKRRCGGPQITKITRWSEVLTIALDEYARRLFVPHAQRFYFIKIRVYLYIYIYRDSHIDIFSRNVLWHMDMPHACLLWVDVISGWFPQPGVPWTSASCCKRRMCRGVGVSHVKSK